MKLSTTEFLRDKLDRTVPACAKIAAMAEAGRITEAEAAFGAFVRASLQPEKYFRIPYYEQENKWKNPEDTEETVYERLAHGAIMSVGPSGTGFLHEFGPEGIQWEANPTPGKYGEWTWQINRHHEFRALGHLYRETGDEKYARLFVKLFESWREQTECPDNVPAYETNAWRTIEIGIRQSKNWPYALHAFYRSPEVSDHFLCEFFASVWENGWRVRNFPMVGNWLIMMMTGLFHIGLLYPFLADAAEWKDYAIKCLTDELNIQIYPDGFQYELTTCYQGVVTDNYSVVLDICRAMEAPLPETFLGVLEKTYRLFPLLAQPDLRLPDINDGARTEIPKICERACLFFPNEPLYRYFASKRASGEPMLSKDTVLPFSGMAVLRDNWEADAQWLFFDSAPFGRGHQHEDKLNLLLFAYGRDLLRDTGYIYVSPEIRQFALSSYAHNTVLVDGLGQNRRSTYHWENDDIKKRSDLAVTLGEEEDVLQGTYDEGYGPDRLAVTHRRTVVKIKHRPLGLKTFYLVIDDMISQDGAIHHYTANWQLENVPVTLENVGSMARADADYDDGVTLTLLTAAGMRVACGEKEPMLGWRAEGPAPAVQCAVSGASARIVTVLYPSNEGCPITGIAYDENAVAIRTEDGLWTREG